MTDQELADMERFWENSPTWAHERIPSLLAEVKAMKIKIGEMQKAIDGIYPYCKVKYGMPEDAVSAIERLEGRGAQKCEWCEKGLPLLAHRKHDAGASGLPTWVECTKNE
jgi:hypothetical protein